jgi:hypothetical protein
MNLSDIDCMLTLEIVIKDAHGAEVTLPSLILAEEGHYLNHPIDHFGPVVFASRVRMFHFQ